MERKQEFKNLEYVSQSIINSSNRVSVESNSKDVTRILEFLVSKFEKQKEFFRNTFEKEYNLLNIGSDMLEPLFSEYTNFLFKLNQAGKTLITGDSFTVWKLCNKIRLYGILSDVLRLKYSANLVERSKLIKETFLYETGWETYDFYFNNILEIEPAINIDKLFNAVSKVNDLLAGYRESMCNNQLQDTDLLKFSRSSFYGVNSINVMKSLNTEKWDKDSFRNSTQTMVAEVCNNLAAVTNTDFNNETVLKAIAREVEIIINLTSYAVKGCKSEVDISNLVERMFDLEGFMNIVDAEISEELFLKINRIVEFIAHELVMLSTVYFRNNWV